MSTVQVQNVIETVQVIDEDQVVIVETNTVDVIEVGIMGPQGIPGPPGAPGSGSASYVHNQGPASALWTINHNLGYFPNVTVIDTTGAVVEGDITYVDGNTMTVGFSAPFSGTAYLS